MLTALTLLIVQEEMYLVCTNSLLQQSPKVRSFLDVA